VTFVISAVIFSVILGHPLWELFYSRILISKEGQELQKRIKRNAERQFFALLQKKSEDELFGVEELSVDVGAIVDAPFELDVRSLSKEPNAEKNDQVEILAPSQHPAIEAVKDALEVYEKKLRSRAQEFFDNGGPSCSAQQSRAKVAWSTKEKEDVRRLVASVVLFIENYTRILLSDKVVLSDLSDYVDMMQKQFCGLYQACVHDILQREPGYFLAVGCALTLMKDIQDADSGTTNGADESDESGIRNRQVRRIHNPEDAAAIPEPMSPTRMARLATLPTPDDPVELFSLAVLAQEPLTYYVEGLAKATGGRLKGAVKHLFRMCEKRTLDPQQASVPPPPPPRPIHATPTIWDAARVLVEYDSMTALGRGLERIRNDHHEGHLRVLRLKDRFSAPTSGGWSDILVNVSLPGSDIPCEIQFVHRQMMLIRQDMGAHQVYARYRSAVEILDIFEAQKASEASRQDGAKLRDGASMPQDPCVPGIPNAVAS